MAAPISTTQVDVTCLILAGCASRPEARALERGRRLVEADCASCHAVLPSGVSPTPEAPPFDQLSRTFRVATLEDALKNGVSVGHPAMPAIHLPPDDVRSVIAYLQSIQSDRR